MNCFHDNNTTTISLNVFGEEPTEADRRALRAHLLTKASVLFIGTTSYSDYAYFKTTFLKIMKHIKTMETNNLCLTLGCTWIFNPVRQEMWISE